MTYRGSAEHGVRILLALLLASSLAVAHEDVGGALVKVEKVYAAPKPLGTLRAAYTASEDAKEQALLVECELFRRNVPAEGLADLPRPDWSGLYVLYSLTSLEGGKLVDRPYLYLVVPLRGPVGTSWEQTWVTFHFDADGKLTRRIKQVMPLSTSAVDMLWEEWSIGSRDTAEAVLEAAWKKRKK